MSRRRLARLASFASRFSMFLVALAAAWIRELRASLELGAQTKPNQ